jgi:hypothetical protein
MAGTQNDEDQLNKEINWKRHVKGNPRGIFNLRPPGVNAIMCFNIIYVFVLWGVTISIAASKRGQPSGHVVDPSTLGILFILGVELLVAVILGERTWVAIGPSARQLLRPIFKWGPWPGLLGILFLLVFLVRLFGLAPMGGNIKNKTYSPFANWKVVPPRKNLSKDVIYAYAVRFCEDHGEGWHVLEESQIPLMSPAFKGREGERYWIRQKNIEFNQGRILKTQCINEQCENVVESQRSSDDQQFKAQTLCFKR